MKVLNVLSVLTSAGEFREIQNFSRTTDATTGESVFKFEGCLENRQPKTWIVLVSQVVACSYASEKSNVSSTNEQPFPVVTPTKQVEYFVFGKCSGLALDGSLGFGDYKDKKSFDAYVLWYNDTKTTNSKWTVMSATGEIYNPPASKQDAVEVKSLFGTPPTNTEPGDDLPF